MNRNHHIRSEMPGPPGYFQSLLLSLPMTGLVFVLLSGGKAPAGQLESLAFFISFAFISTIFFLMIKTGKTDKWRSILFVIYSVCFVLSFTTNLVVERGSMAVTAGNMIEGDVPFCHMVIPMTLIPAVFAKTIIFPGTMIGGHAAIAAMLVLWLGASLAVGRGFCSWFCFFGGMDEGFSRLFKKARIPHIHSRWRYLPYALLLVLALASLAMIAPVYCEWLCPFKTVTEYGEINSIKSAVQAVIFVGLFLALVVVLPALTRRRVQCGLFCPMGAFQSLTNKINAFDIRVNRNLCANCGKCMTVCPTFSINEQTLEKGKAAMTCTKCGKCVDACPVKAISYHIKGTAVKEKTGRFSRNLFVYAAFILLATMSGGYLQDAIVKIVHLAYTGQIV